MVGICEKDMVVSDFTYGTPRSPKLQRPTIGECTTSVTMGRCRAASPDGHHGRHVLVRAAVERVCVYVKSHVNQLQMATSLVSGLACGRSGKKLWCALLVLRGQSRVSARHSINMQNVTCNLAVHRPAQLQDGVAGVHVHKAVAAMASNKAVAKSCTARCEEAVHVLRSDACATATKFSVRVIVSSHSGDNGRGACPAH